MTIVVALLASPEGEAAFAEAVRVGAVEKVPVTVVPLDESAAARAQELLGALASDAATPSVDEPLRGTDLVDAFLGRAEQLSASLIVIGLRKRSTVGKLILGSNAQRILLDAPVPVLTVKPADDAR